MKHQYLVLVLLMAVLTFLLSGCGSKTGPEEVYWQYWDACSKGEFQTAEEYILESAQEAAKTLGSCGFTHDAINTFEANKGNPPRTFSKDPEVSIQDTISSLIWIDDQGNIATVRLVKTEDVWKIVETTWSR